MSFGANEPVPQGGLPASGQPKLLGLELSRGVAAILVLLYHIDKYYFGNPKYDPNSLLGGVFRFGHSGVQFFFVLSGFIMIWSHWDDLGQRAKVGSFVRKRVVRIYPLAWFSTLALLAMYLLVPAAGQATYRSPLVILESLALVGRDPHSAINFPSWTLWHENLFYLFCAAIIWRPRLGTGALLIWALACSTWGVWAAIDVSTFYPLAPVNALFALGVSAAWFLKRATLPAAWAVLVAGLMGFFGFGFASNMQAFGESVEDAAYGVAALMIVASLVQLERDGRLRLPAQAALAGTLSFPLYLTHMISLPIIAKAMAALHLIPRLPAVVSAVIMAVGAGVGAMMVHRFFERPASRAMRKLLLPGATGNAAKASAW